MVVAVAQEADVYLIAGSTRSGNDLDRQLAQRLKDQGNTILLRPCDTFRAPPRPPGSRSGPAARLRDRPAPANADPAGVAHDAAACAGPGESIS